MEITRIYTDTEGNSHFEMWPVIMENESTFGFMSSPELNVKSFHFQNTLPHHEWNFLHSPDKMYVVLLSGALELEVRDGEKSRSIYQAAGARWSGQPEPARGSGAGSARRQHHGILQGVQRRDPGY